MELLPCVMQAVGLGGSGSSAGGAQGGNSGDSAGERARREQQEAERRAAAAERARKDAEEKLRAAEARREAEERQRAADEARRAAEEKLRAAQARREAEESQRRADDAQRRSRELGTMPLPRLWRTPGGNVLELRESNGAVTVIAREISQIVAGRGGHVGDNVFSGTRRGNRIVGETVVLGSPGCSIRVGATLVFDGDQMNLQVPFTPIPHCGFAAVGARNDFWTQAR